MKKKLRGLFFKLMFSKHEQTAIINSLWFRFKTVRDTSSYSHEILILDSQIKVICENLAKELTII